MYMHPDAYLHLLEQDRERAMTQRALERAARAGGLQRPGLARGGITSLVRAIRTAAAAAGRVRPGGFSGFGGSRSSSPLPGLPGR